MSTINIKTILPAEHFILVKPDIQPEKTVSGIYLPQNATDKPQTGVVVAQREDSKYKNDTHVIYKKWGGNDINIDGEEYIFLHEDDILGTYGN